MRNFVDIQEINLNQLNIILEDSARLKNSRINLPKGALDIEPTLSGRIVALLFKKPSTRTRFSFDVGINQMGGKSIPVSSNEMQLSNAERMSDTAQVLSKYVDMIVLRTDDHHDLLDLTENSVVPVINGLSNFSHPCQVLADVFTFEELAGSIKGRKVVWLGDGNNVCNSYLQAAEKFDFEFVYSGPKAFRPEHSKKSSHYVYERDPENAVDSADLLVTDTWFSMHQTERERDKRAILMNDYCITERLLMKTKSECLIFHCMPIYREKEISSEVVDQFFKVFLAQAENRLHVQKSIMKWCFE
mgnify:CR=1 FL=1